jgi:hypothetical protein
MTDARGELLALADRFAKFGLQSLYRVTRSN